MDFILRQHTPDDEAYIYQTFKNEYYKTFPYTPYKLYEFNQSKIIAWLLQNVNVLIACFPEEPDQIRGYLLYQFINDQLVIHWLHVRLSGHGMATQILKSIHPTITKDEPIICTHLTTNFFMLKKHANLVYDPYLITNLRLNK